MNQASSYEELLAEVMLLRESDRRKSERIAYLERLLYGVKSDRMASKAAEANQPGLFDELFDRAYDERSARIQQAAQEIKAEAEKRRKTSRTKTNRPSNNITV